MDKTIDYKAMGQRIRGARTKRGISQEKLGEMCGISTAHIGHIERGTRIPSLETVFKLSVELDVSIDHLLFDSVNDYENVFKSISSQLEGKDDDKIRSFLATVKILADKINEL